MRSRSSAVISIVHRLGMEDVRAYQLHLIEQKFSWSHINQVACALRVFYGIGQALRLEGEFRGVPHATRRSAP
jgi:Phage integrase, N-terminal SAM-like domain